MSKNKPPRTPSFRHHKATDQGFIELNGRCHYLGRFDLPETRERYHRTIAELLANCGAFVEQNCDVTISELISQFWKHVTAQYVRPDGAATFEQANFRQALRRRQARGRP